MIKTYYVLHILSHGSVSRKQPKMFQIIANMVPIWVQDGVMCKAPTNLKAHDQTTLSAAMAHNLHRTHNAQPSSSPQAKGPAAEALAIKYTVNIPSLSVDMPSMSVDMPLIYRHTDINGY